MRVLLIVLALYHGLNGIVMLVAPAVWYAAVPGVVDSGPLNDHFVRDIGFGFLAAACALIMARAHTAMLWPASVFLSGHALLHLVEMGMHGATMEAALRDFATIIVPGLLPLWLAVLSMRSGRVEQ